MKKDERVFTLGERLTIRLNDKSGVVVEVDGEVKVSSTQTHEPQAFGVSANDEAGLCAIRGVVEYFGATATQSLDVEVRLGEQGVHFLKVFRDKPYIDERSCLRFIEVDPANATA